VIGCEVDVSSITTSSELMEEWRKTDDALGSLAELLKDTKAMAKAAYDNAGEINDFQSKREPLLLLVNDIERLLGKLRRVIGTEDE